jgi:hypothetical protein
VLVRHRPALLHGSSSSSFLDLLLSLCVLLEMMSEGRGG